MKDLRSNDGIERQLEASIQKLRFNYRRKRVDGSPKPTDITAGAAAKTLLAIWGQVPHQATSS